MFTPSHTNVKVALLFLSLFYYLQQSDAAFAQLKSQQSLSQQKPVQQGHQNLHPQQQAQQQLQQQQQQQQLPPHQIVQAAQYVHEKDTRNDPETIKTTNQESELNDPYQMLNEMKQETAHMPLNPLPWNPYLMPAQLSATALPTAPFNMPQYAEQSYERLSMLETPKFLPVVGYPQPVFIPYPFFIAPELFYPALSGTMMNDIEDTMSRAANSRRPSSSSHARNSPIYYVRLPPTPYMFLPSLGYTPSSQSATTNYGSNFSPLLPYQAVPTFPSFSSIFNLPLNFLANGKPSGIYQMNGSPSDIQSLHFPSLGGFGSRPSLPSSMGGTYLPQPPYGIAAPAPPPPHQDSKMTSLKRPFVFNGRPEDIYILQNNFNPLYSDNNYF